MCSALICWRKPRILLNHSWHTLSGSEVAQLLESDTELGLPFNEATNRQRRYGSNELVSREKTSSWRRFLQQFQQPVQYILLVAGTVTALFKEVVDAGVIFAVAVGNALIGFIQEARAENAIAALAEVVTTEATVIRDDEKARISSRELVPGDLIVLATGDRVPADIRLTEAFDLQIDESGLTGESLPVDKTTEPLAPETLLPERTNMAYSGSLVTAGQGRGFVVAIGNQTETGRVAQLMQESTNLMTPLARRIQRFSRTLLYFVLGMAALAFAVGAVRSGYAWVETFKSAVALAVSAVPEGLPAIVTITLAIGVSRMAKRHAIVRKLPAVETLGSTTVICSDKTGTLTKNQMTVQEVYAGGRHYTVSGTGYDFEGAISLNDQMIELNTSPALRDCLLAGLLCNDSHLQQEDGQWEVVGDPTEGALLGAAHKAGLDREVLEEEIPRLDVLPFDSKLQYMATLHQDQSNRVIYAKGSVEALLTHCQFWVNGQGEKAPMDLDAVRQQADDTAGKGLRVLAFAKKPVAPDQETIEPDDLNQGLIFLGLQGMIDPPRPEAIEAVRACKMAGIQVKMITGDHPITAVAIARTIGLGQTATAFTGQELAQMEPQELANAVENTDVFARVAPEQKLRLVEALQAKGEIVAMTGDGVNDAPALSQADIGVAMGMGTEVAKEAADMVLTDNNFASIAAAVEEGRTAYRNIRRAIGFILPISGGESLTILMGTLVSTVLPILPVQVLWVNMVSAIALSLPLAFEPKSERAMQQPPRNPNEPLLSGRLGLRILVISVWNAIATFGTFEWMMRTTGDVDVARTVAINVLVSSEIFYLLSICRLIPSLVANLWGQQKTISYAPAIGIGTLVILQVLFSQWSLMNELFDTAPLSPAQGLFILALGLPVILWALILQQFDPIN
ncbi:HAD-IC family P-type ATPase [Myxacorys almedinensis]|uniref:cation-translocating P-type ATPase n=1 Tax=Myxacorys almedinensis TaxID=2651157 RepID=UPI003082CD25